MSTGSSPSPSTGAARKQRSSTERLIVWGIILVLLALVGIEFTARAGFDNAMKALTDKMQAIDGDASGKLTVTETDVKAAVGGKAPDSTEDLTGKGISNNARRLDTYRWFSLNPFTERRLYIYYGFGKHKGNDEPPDVLDVTTERVVTAAEKYPALSEEEYELSFELNKYERAGHDPPPETAKRVTEEVQEFQAARRKAKAEGKSAEEVTRIVDEIKAKHAAARGNSRGKGAKKASTDAGKANESKADEKKPDEDKADEK